MKNLKETMKTQTGAFFIKFFNKEKQVKWSIKMIDKKITGIIEQESEKLPPDRTRLCEQYWKAYKEMLNVLLIIDDEKAINDAYNLLGIVIDDGAFHYYLHEISDIVHSYHPTYMRIRYEVERSGELA